MDSHLGQEFAKNQGATLLTALPKAILEILRYYELAAVTDTFQPRAPLSGPRLRAQTYWYFVVTDWSLVLIAVGNKGVTTPRLEIPLLNIADMVSQAKCSSHFTEFNFLHACV
jgi:hypothetical protein